MTARLCNISVDGEPPTTKDDANDILSRGLGWSVGVVRPATPQEWEPSIGSVRLGGDGVYKPDAWFMVELPAVIEQQIAEAERNNLHYWAAIWRQTLGTVWINVEVATTW